MKPNQFVQRRICVLFALAMWLLPNIVAAQSAKLPAGIPNFKEAAARNAADLVAAKKAAFIQAYPAISKHIASDATLSAQYGITATDLKAIPVKPQQAFTRVFTQAELATMSEIDQAEARLSGAIKTN